MDEPRGQEIDFESWSELARSDPQAFEARRTRLLEEIIRSAPPHRQDRLRRLQWRIDQIRRTSRTPLAACNRLQQLMLDTVYGPNGLLDAMKRVQAHSETPPRALARPASVLPFRPRGGPRRATPEDVSRRRDP
jgi:hypothetical protein